jgi:hypothetical protein
MDPTILAALITASLRELALMQERAASGTITQADIDKMLVVLDHTLDTWQAKVDAHKASQP